MRRALAKFNQGDWAKKYGHTSPGFCYTLTADWCADILRDAKDRTFKAPGLSSEARMGKFDSKAIADSVAGDQARYIAANEENQQSVGIVDALLQVTKSKYLEPVPNRDLITVVTEMTQEARALAEGVLRAGLNARGLVAGTATITTPGLCHTHLEAASAYVIGFTCGNVGHAIGVYVTSGIFTWDYYIFDPNYGEFMSNTTADFGIQLGVLFKAYSQTPTLRLTEVQLP